jgi:hypothetical protein
MTAITVVIEINSPKGDRRLDPCHETWFPTGKKLAGNTSFTTVRLSEQKQHVNP